MVSPRMTGLFFSKITLDINRLKRKNIRLKIEVRNILPTIWDLKVAQEIEERMKRSYEKFGNRYQQKLDS